MQHRLKLQFSRGYELDLETLLGPGLQQVLPSMQTSASKDYIAKLKGNDTDDDGPVLAAAAFVLWGPLIIGGGRSLESKISKAYGKGCTHVFQSICELDREAHDELKDRFAECFDNLPEMGISCEELLENARLFMNMNNKLMLSIKMEPFGLGGCSQIAALVIAVLCVLMLFLLPISRDPTFE